MRITALALVFASFSALACPELVGTYSSCRSTTGNLEGSVDVNVTQTVENGITTYTMSMKAHNGDPKTVSFIADGKTYSESQPSPYGTAVMAVTSSCPTADTLTIVNSTTLGGNPVMELTIASRKDGAKMIQEAQGAVFGRNIQDTIICE